MQTALDAAKGAVDELLKTIQEEPKLKADAARGYIRAPQLALVELQLRRLDLLQQPFTENQGHADVQQKAESISKGQTTPVDDLQDADSDSKGHEAPDSTTDITRGLAEAVLTYYKQLGHMLSCAADLR